jgi:hypothetical protein
MHEREGDHAESSRRPNFEEMARAIHASYLSRWNRHDPRQLRRTREEVQGPDKEQSSVA